MYIAKKIGSCFIMYCALLTSVGLYASESNSEDKKMKTESTLVQVLNTQVLDTLKHSDCIPGLKSDEFLALKTDITKTWGTLLKDGVLEISGTDKDIRPYFVALQAVLEHVLASELQKNVKVLKGIIHTPMPATPLCSKGEISKELIDPSIELDPMRLFTVKARTTIIRDYLFKGGDLYIVYPKDGYGKRTEEQQKIYQQELANYPKHLFDIPLNCEGIPNELIGATYLFQDQLGNKFVFAIKMTQAKDPQDVGNFGLWFGSQSHPAIQVRLKAVEAYLEQNKANVSLK